ncbi:probable serine/threonine-protein kinase nek3 isoform X1 [Drosophila montana]|uniref:probable serine/threonine-protein kinase nek3 isoform X1 n=1 Tax=Drosophila montana TaxID=40370 RepID=UPI00313D5DE0
MLLATPTTTTASSQNDAAGAASIVNLPTKHNETLVKLKPTASPLTAMLANVPSTSSAVAASASAAVATNVTADACDERTRLLGSTPTPPLAASPPTTLALPLPLVHAATHPSRSSNNNHSGANNNNDNDLEASNNNYNNNENNRSDVDDLSEETATTAGAADSSDQSDKFNRPPTNQKKPKLSKLGTKSVGLKRVSFGSSKGSMVETLVFETPTPLSEHVEPNFGFDAADAAGAAAGQPPQAITAAATHLPLVSSNSTYGDYAKLNMDDSGIEVQEESERSIVRVSIYQSSQPQQICPPAEYTLTSFSDNLDNTFSSYNCNLDYTQMATATMQPAGGLGPAYDRQQSTDSGWDNPFRPGGDLSREADEIVSMIRGGKPITPTEDRTIGNGNAQHGDDNCNGASTAIGETVTKTNLSQNQATAQNGTNSHGSKVASSTGAGGGGGGAAAVTAAGKAESNNGVTSLAQVSKQVVPGPTSASHVVIDEKKNKKKGCCVVQ